MTRRNVIKSFIGVLLSACLAVFAMLCAMNVFGWFSMSHDVTGNGMGIQSKDYRVLDILKIVDGPNIGVEVATKDMDKLEDVMQSEKFIPSAFGKFTFYVHDSSSSGEQYSFIYSISVKNNEFCDDENFPNGLHPGVNTGSEDFIKAEQYINSHIMFFEKKDENGYSEWICPDKPTRCTSETGGTKEVTVYWIWMDQYEQIFEENSGLIQEDTRKEIAEYYSKEENIEKLLVNGEKSSEVYNVADTVIGMTYKYVCFEIKVTRD